MKIKVKVPELNDVTKALGSAWKKAEKVIDKVTFNVLEETAEEIARKVIAATDKKEAHNG
jgi:hypothetical protein